MFEYRYNLLYINTFTYGYIVIQLSDVKERECVRVVWSLLHEIVFGEDTYPVKEKKAT